MMRAWVFVALAYGIVWGTIVIYLFLLKRRYTNTAAELAALKSEEASSRDAKK
jgi:CcmD family protein